MNKDKKSMDDVLASIRRIIRTDPNAVPPDAASLPPGLVGSDETAKSVLEKLRGDDELLGKPLSTSDDPEETARAVLEALRKQAEAEKAKQPQPEKAKQPEAATAPPDLEKLIEEPPAVEADTDDVPVVDDAEPADAPAPPKAVPAGPPPKKAAEPAAAPAPAPVRSRPAAIQPAPKPAAPRPPKEAPVMLDEAAMEAMVRRIVRDELMGEMGQRMTKNVQKMIRDEIGRGRIEKK